MSAALDIRVSPSLDPETVKAVEGYNDETAPFVSDVVSAFNDTYITLGRVHDAAELWANNPAVTRENAILIVGREGARQKERVSRLLDRAHDDLKKRIAHVEGELSRPLVQQAALGSLNVEVRAHLKGLSRSERNKLLNEALATDDEATLTAALGGQAFLSGLSREDHDHYVHQYHVRKSPHLVARLALMRGVLDLIHRSGPILHRQFDKAVGGKPSEVAAIQKLDERAKAALDIQPSA